MAKLLNTKLPISLDPLVVPSFVYNRMVRTVEIAFAGFDPSATPQFTETIRNENLFNAGDIIWNTTREVLQYFDGTNWYNLSTEEEVGLQAKASVGEVTVTLDGNVTINITGPKYGWGIEKWYT
jgi:hypothetical protein|tara:strand:- start:938 stop:1309 length:372 start_codon:yes stop_codon:yes gene_type:complete